MQEPLSLISFKIKIGVLYLTYWSNFSGMLKLKKTHPLRRESKKKNLIPRDFSAIFAIEIMIIILTSNFNLITV